MHHVRPVLRRILRLWRNCVMAERKTGLEIPLRRLGLFEATKPLTPAANVPPTSSTLTSSTPAPPATNAAPPEVAPPTTLPLPVPGGAAPAPPEKGARRSR